MISLNADGEIIRAEKGDMVFFPSGSRHGLIGCGSEDLYILRNFLPTQSRLFAWLDWKDSVKM
ncbi:MAG: hypothetical protein ACJ0BS_03195 [Paracoccaceae bacterium]